MDGYAVREFRAGVERNPRVNAASLPNPCASAKETECSYLRPGTDLYLILDHDVRTYSRSSRQLR
jgi:hypothetical protein